MSESLKTKLQRWGFNFFPAYRGTGGRIEYISHDYREIHIRIPLNWRTRNYVGTSYGGSMYGAVDPIYMIMLIKVLGSDYIVWDKAASIRFKRPGKETLFAKFVVTDEEIEVIKNDLKDKKSIDRVYEIELKTKDERVHAVVEKTIYIARKENAKE